MGTKRTVQVRVVKGNPAIMCKASELLREESADRAESYLRSKGLIGDDERLYSRKYGSRREDRTGPTSVVAPVSFGVMLNAAKARCPSKV
jgi:hypothetical protein